MLVLKKNGDWFLNFAFLFLNSPIFHKILRKKTNISTTRNEQFHELLLNFWGQRGADVCKSCTNVELEQSCKESVSTTAEHELSKILLRKTKKRRTVTPHLQPKWFLHREARIRVWSDGLPRRWSNKAPRAESQATKASAVKKICGRRNEKIQKFYHISFIPYPFVLRNSWLWLVMARARQKSA